MKPGGVQANVTEEQEAQYRRLESRMRRADRRGSVDPKGPIVEGVDGLGDWHTTDPWSADHESDLVSEVVSDIAAEARVGDMD